MLIDERTRPKAPKIEGATEAQRRQGGQLAMIHQLHLLQIAQVEDVIHQIEAGKARAIELGHAVSSLQMAANYRILGNLCGRECQMLTYHHSGEDQSIFPVLMQGSEGLRLVVERLIEEHTVIHGLIEQMGVQAEALTDSPDPVAFLTLKKTFITLVEIVRSHFRYEQTELKEALGYYDAL